MSTRLCLSGPLRSVYAVNCDLEVIFCQLTCKAVLLWVQSLEPTSIQLLPCCFLLILLCVFNVLLWPIFCCKITSIYLGAWGLCILDTQYLRCFFWTDISDVVPSVSDHHCLDFTSHIFSRSSFSPLCFPVSCVPSSRCCCHLAMLHLSPMSSSAVGRPPLSSWLATRMDLEGPKDLSSIQFWCRWTKARNIECLYSDPFCIWSFAPFLRVLTLI